LRSGLAVARRRGPGEALDGRCLLRPGRLARAARRGADRALPEARRGDLPAGLARLGRRDRVDRRDRARVGYAVDLERGNAHVQRGLAEAGMRESTRRDFLRTSSWAGLGLLAAGCAPKVADFAQNPRPPPLAIAARCGAPPAPNS